MTLEIFVPTTKRKYKFNLVEIANFIVLKSLSNLEGGGGGGGGGFLKNILLKHNIQTCRFFAVSNCHVIIFLAFAPKDIYNGTPDIIYLDFV